jgi:chondroitin synthase
MARDLPLPPLWGVGNDYSFLERRLDKRGWLRNIEGYSPTLSVSVIIAVHNRARLLELCLESLARQDYPREQLELIVVDDKSTDGAERVCRSSRWPDLRYIRLPFHDGHTEALARNAGIRSARHPLVVQMDPDILLGNPDALRWIVRWFEIAEHAVVTVSRNYIQSAGIQLGDVRADQFPRLATGEDDGREMLKRDPNALKHRYMPYLEVLGFLMAYWRADAFNAGLQAEQWTEYGGVDQEFAYRLYEQGAYCIHESNVDALHLHHPRQQLAGRHREFLASRIPAYRSYRYPGHYTGKVETPRCSVYVPVRNGAKYLQEAINSALNQTYKDLEVVVVDDGSTDATPKILERMSRVETRLRWERTAPKGCASASNTAIKIARGELILQLDGDDVLHPFAAERMIREFDRRPWIGFVYGRLVRTDARLTPQVVGQTYKSYHRHHNLLCMHVCAPRMWRRRLHFLVGGHDETLESAVDYDIVLKMSERDLFYHLDEILYYYRIRPGSLSSFVAAQQENGLQAVRKALTRMRLDAHFVPRLNVSQNNRWYSYIAESV